MTFPLVGDLPDPWIDGENPNAAAMKLRITDKLNALATALGTRTARVSASCVLPAVATVNSGTVTAVPVGSITTSTGGTFSITSGRLVLPSNGVWALLAKVQWFGYTVTAVRNFLDIGTGAVPFTNTTLRGRVGLPVGEDFMVVSGFHTVTGAGDNSVAVEIFQASGSAKATNAGALDVVKISD